jgi:hypothetical protein
MTDLPQLLAFVAADLDERFYPYAGAVRMAARELRELRRRVESVGWSDAGCEFCGGELIQPAGAGRRRRFCSDRHRRQFAEMGRSA